MNFSYGTFKASNGVEMGIMRLRIPCIYYMPTEETGPYTSVALPFKQFKTVTTCVA